MSASTDEENSADTMISAKYRVDVPIGGDGTENGKTLLCAHRSSPNSVIYAITKGSDLLICDGNSDVANVIQRFTLEFEIKKIMYHSFKPSRSLEKKSKFYSKHGMEALWKEESVKEREFLVVCGEHRLLFIAVTDYHFYHYEIPFKLRNVFAITNGILVERFYDASNEQSFHYHDTFHLYSLSGPFGELLPVIYKTIRHQPHWKFCWQSHEDDAEMVGSDRNFVVVFDEKEKNHRIYMSRETEEEEVQSAIRYVETQRKQYHESMMFSNTNNQYSARTPRQIADMASMPSIRSPAMIALSEVINSEIEGRSPQITHSRPGFGHSTPNNANGQYQGSLPTPIFEGASDSKIWATTPAATPRMNTRTNAKNLERNIHTRSLARMAQTDDNQAAGPSTAQTSAHSPFTQGLQTLANPFNSSQFGTPKMPNQRWKRANGNAELLREFTRMIRDTPRKRTRNSAESEQSHMDFGDLERDPDLDLLLSKVCLECVYVEPKQLAISRADKIFVSHCLTQLYLNLVSHHNEKIKIISLWNNCEKTKKELAESPNDKIVVTDCRDATVLEKSGLTVVMGIDSSVALYGGMEKISLIYIHQQDYPFTDHFRLHSFVGNVFAAMNEQVLTRIALPPACECDSVNDLLRTCFLNLPLPFAQYLLRLWRSYPRIVHDQKRYWNMEVQELHEVVLFLLKNVGIDVTDMNARRNTESPEVGGKQMKPRHSAAEIWQRMKDFADECEGQCVERKTDDLDDYDNEVIRNQFTIFVETPPNQYMRQLFYALHAQFEEWTLDTFTHHLLSHLLTYLHILGQILGETRYLNYYRSAYTSMFKSTGFIFSNKLDAGFFASSAPLEMMSLIGKIYSSTENLTSLAEVCRVATKKCLRILVVVAAGASLINSVTLDMTFWLGKDFVKRLGMNGEMKKGFYQILSMNHIDGSAKANNLMRLFEIDTNQIANMTMGLRILLLKYQAEAYAGMKSLEPKECIYASHEETTTIWSYRFPHDIRVRNIEVMLDSSKPVLVATNTIQSTQDSTVKEKQDKFLQQTSLRYFSQAFGRALFAFRTDVPSLLQPLDFPQLAVGGSLYPARVSCDPPNNDTYKLHLEWAEFYNSVAAALRVGSSDMVKIDNEWMLMTSKAGKSAAAVAGLTFGFGLNGHLNTLNMYHAHQMLATFDRFHSVALLIGLSASKFCTCDVQVYKILATYLPFLMGPTMLDIKLDCTVQTAAISALGLLFADSGNMNIAKKLVNEIGRSLNSEDEPVSDRFAYKLSAGFSLGLIMLGKGNGASVTSLPFKQKIPQLSERLICMMNGGLKSHCVFLPHIAPPAPAEASTLPFGPPGGGPGHSANQIPNHVQDSSNINIHLSSQPAIIALGFMFMKTGDEFIASQLALPESITDLEKIRPDFIFTRILAYCLIMWDKVEIDDDFVNELVPPKVMEFMAVGLKYGGDQDENDLREDENEYWDEIVDRYTLSQTYLMTIAGACTVIALKFCCAGGPPEMNASRRAFRLLEHFISIVIPEGEIEKKSGHKRVCDYAGPATVSLVFSSLIMAMGIVNVGLGDKYTMRYARLLRICEKLEKEVWMNNSMKHHEQILAHETLGMLLMGGGRYAFKKDNLSIALIIISILPVVTQNVADNAHYHQPLRFLWALAAEPRLLVPFDSSDYAVIECDCIIHLKKPFDRVNKVYCVKAPCIIPPIEDIESIEVGGGQYELVRISLNTDEDRKLMEEILSIGQGRIRLKRFGKPAGLRFACEPNKSTSYYMFCNDEDSLYCNPPYFVTPSRDDSPNLNQDEFEPDVYTEVIDIESLLTSENTAMEVPSGYFEGVAHELFDTLRLKRADKYPQVQMHLNTFKETINRTPEAMSSLLVTNVKLVQKIVDGWQDEDHLAQKLREVIDTHA